MVKIIKIISVKAILIVFFTLMLASMAAASNYAWCNEPIEDAPYGFNYIMCKHNNYGREYGCDMQYGRECGCNKHFSSWSLDYEAQNTGCQKHFSSWSLNYKDNHGNCGANGKFSSWSLNYERLHRNCC